MRAPVTFSNLPHTLSEKSDSSLEKRLASYGVMSLALAAATAGAPQPAYAGIIEPPLSTAVSGQVFFSMNVLMQDPDSVSERIASDSYAQQALVPASPWLDATIPATPVAAPRLDSTSGEMDVDMDPAPGEKRPWLWVVQARGSTGWTTQIVPGSELTHLLAGRGETAPSDVWVYAVGRTGNLSLPARVRPLQNPLAVIAPGRR